MSSNKKRVTIPNSALEEKARWVRLQVLEKIVETGKGHLGGIFSCVDLLVALYYGGLLKINPKKPSSGNRDRFILSKGHACLALYAIFWDLGILSKRQYDSYSHDGGLGGQLDLNIPGIDFNTGSLGHSVGVSAGMALAAKLNQTNAKVISLVGDSELFEGSVWEAFIFAAKWKLNNLVVIVDRNRLMVTDTLEDEGPFYDFSDKIKGFGWNLFEIDGHNFGQISQVFEVLKNVHNPTLILANTIRGKGVSFIENNIDWYTKTPTKKEYLLAKKELLRQKS